MQKEMVYYFVRATYQRRWTQDPATIIEETVMSVLWAFGDTRCITIARPVISTISMFVWIVTRLEGVVWNWTIIYYS